MGFALRSTEYAELIRRATSRQVSAAESRRARMILLLSEGATWNEVMQRLGCSRGFIARWVKRFRTSRMGGMYAQHRGQSPSIVTPAVEARILKLARRQAGSSTRRLGEHFGISHMSVHRVLVKHGVRRGSGD